MNAGIAAFVIVLTAINAVGLVCTYAVIKSGYKLKS